MENKKKKVLFFLPGSVGGAERMTITIAKMLPLDRYDVKFIIIDKSRGIIDNFIPNNYPVKFLKIRNIWDFVTFRIAGILKEENPEYAFSSLRYLNYRLLMATTLISNKVKVVVRNDNYLSTLRWYEPYILRYTYPKAYRNIAQQQEMKDEMVEKLNIDPKRVIVLQNPIDIENIVKKSSVESPYSDVEQKCIKYVWVARFARQKGHDILVKAFSQVIKNIQNAKLILVGKYDESSEYYKEINQYVHKNEMEAQIKFVGYDSNPYRWVKNADCFVMPSRIEGLPNALIEAMYLGKPVVATTCIPVVSRIVKDGYNGILVPSEDYKAMAKAMIEALKLKDFTMTYEPANNEDFRNLFK